MCISRHLTPETRTPNGNNLRVEGLVLDPCFQGCVHHGGEGTWSMAAHITTARIGEMWHRQGWDNSKKALPRGPPLTLCHLTEKTALRVTRGISRSLSQTLRIQPSLGHSPLYYMAYTKFFILLLYHSVSLHPTKSWVRALSVFHNQSLQAPL